MRVTADISARAIRAVNPADAKAMAAIHAACFARPWDNAAMTRLIADPACLSLLATSDQDAAARGLIIARLAADEAELLTLCVAPIHHRRGVAALLVEAAIAFLRTCGVRQLYLEVEDGNTAALALYRSFGAVPIGRRKAYYESGADAAIFSLAL